ncbi:MAG: molybdopterin-guanine dinucleotide biosynthesis protein MobB [Spirochaetes bacterium]|nr:molybdopterin-guanine dinucleotide biosynthesis protein MobB [Spirochaetota bacterium]
MKQKEKAMVIVVGGAHSKVGKTELVCRLIGRLENVCAVKCVVSEKAEGASLVLSKQELEKEGKDTARYILAGADRVVMARAPRKELVKIASMLDEIANKYRYMIIEGNSIVTYVKPDHIIFIDDGSNAGRTPGSRLTEALCTVRIRAFDYDLDAVIGTLEKE